MVHIEARSAVLQLTDWMCRRTGGSGCGNGYRRDDETKLLTLFVMTREHGALFGVGLETGIDQVSEILRHARVCDAAGLDLVSLTDHPYFAERIDAYATLSFVLGATTNISAAAVMTNLLSRPAPILARTATGLSAISGGLFRSAVSAWGRAWG